MGHKHMPVAQAAERRTIRVGGARVPYAVYGERQAGRNPAVLIGGLSTQPENSWGNFANALDREVFAFGFPEGILHPMIPTLLGLVRYTGQGAKKVIRDEYGPHVKPDIGGWSLGGAAVQAMVMRTPLNPSPISARRLFILASYPLGVPQGPVMPRSEHLRSPLSLIHTKRGGRDFGAMYGGKLRTHPEVHAGIKHLLERSIPLLPHVRELTAAMGCMALTLPNVMCEWTGMAPIMKTLEGDMLAVNARDDPVIMADASIEMAASIGMRMEMLEEGGHLHPVLEPITAQIVRDFLDEP